MKRLPVEWPPSSPNFLSSNTLKSNLTDPSLYQSPPSDIWSHSDRKPLAVCIHSLIKVLYSLRVGFSSLHQSVCELSFRLSLPAATAKYSSYCGVHLLFSSSEGKYLTFISIQVLQSSCSAQIILLNPVNPVYHS